MELFFRLFDVGVPCEVVIAAALFAALIHILYYIRNRRHTLTPWVVATLFVMLYSTVFGRMMRGVSVDADLQLMPLWSIGAIQGGGICTLYEKIYNVLFFVPYGYLLCLRADAVSRRQSREATGADGMIIKRLAGWQGAIVIGAVTSVAIELLQLATKTGTCETDDVICNTMGCAIGVAIALLQQLIARNASLRP